MVAITTTNLSSLLPEKFLFLKWTHIMYTSVFCVCMFFINSASPVTSWTWTSDLTCITIALPSNQMMWRKTDKVYGSAKPSQIIRPLNTDVLLKACFNIFFFFLTDHVLSWICSSVERLTTVGHNHVWVEQEVQAGKCIKRRGSTERRAMSVRNPYSWELMSDLAEREF